MKTNCSLNECKRILTSILVREQVFVYFLDCVALKHRKGSATDWRMDIYSQYLDRTYPFSWIASFAMWGDTKQGAAYWSNLSMEFRKRIGDTSISSECIDTEGCKSIW